MTTSVPFVTDVVTGGAGFIGSHLVDRLVADGRRVRVIDNFRKGLPQNLRQHEGCDLVEVVQADVLDVNALRRALEGAERVFHLSAMADIVPSIETPEIYFQSNVVGTLNVLQAARTAGVKRLVYAASSSCYGIPDVFPTDETAEIRPQYPYALTKFMGEQLVLHWAQTYKLPALSLRLFNVYGPRVRTDGAYGAVFGVFLAQMIAGQPLTIVGDGTQTRDFTFVTDVVDAFVKAADSDKVGDILNVGSRGTYSVNRLVELIGAEETVRIPKRPGEPDCTWADVTRIERELGWRAQVNLEDGVNIMLDNIDYWREAPVWTPESIAEATKGWFKYLDA